MIPDEAVEAAAEAINMFAAKYVGVLDPVRLNDMSWLDREHALGEARAALEAAAPHMLAEAWHLAYWQGIMDERRGLDALECGPSRANPYRSQA